MSRTYSWQFHEYLSTTLRLFGQLTDRHVAFMTFGQAETLAHKTVINPTSFSAKNYFLSIYLGQHCDFLSILLPLTLGLYMIVQHIGAYLAWTQFLFKFNFYLQEYSVALIQLLFILNSFHWSSFYFGNKTSQ